MGRRCGSITGPMAGIIALSSLLAGSFYGNSGLVITMCYHRQPVKVAFYLVSEAHRRGATLPPCK